MWLPNLQCGNGQGKKGSSVPKIQKHPLGSWEVDGLDAAQGGDGLFPENTHMHMRTHSERGKDKTRLLGVVSTHKEMH